MNIHQNEGQSEMTIRECCQILHSEIHETSTGSDFNEIETNIF